MSTKLFVTWPTSATEDSTHGTKIFSLLFFQPRLHFALHVTFEIVLSSNIVNSDREEEKQGGLVRLILLQSCFLTFHLKLCGVWRMFCSSRPHVSVRFARLVSRPVSFGKWARSVPYRTDSPSRGDESWWCGGVCLQNRACPSSCSAYLLSSTLKDSHCSRPSRLPYCVVQCLFCHLLTMDFSEYCPPVQFLLRRLLPRKCREGPPFRLW